MSTLVAVTRTESGQIDRTCIANPPNDAARAVLAAYERERKAGRFSPDVIRFELQSGGAGDHAAIPDTDNRTAMQLTLI